MDRHLHRGASDLASGWKSKVVLYGAIRKDTSSFIPDEYRPSDVILQDPRNMHLNDIRKVLHHCYAHQAESGPKASFHFAAFVGPKKVLFDSKYPEDSNTRRADPERNHRTGRKAKGKQREDALHGLLRLEEPAEDTPPSETKNQDQRSPDSAEAGAPDALVTIDMGQMLELKDMGYKVFGPLNGPNDGYPEYQVPSKIFDALTSRRQMQRVPNASDSNNPPPSPVGAEPGPSCIDPTLDQIERIRDHAEPDSNIRDTNLLSGNEDGPLLNSMQSNVHLTTPLNKCADQVPDPPLDSAEIEG